MHNQRLDREFHEEVARENAIVLSRELGKGSEAIVYEAVEAVRGRVVAVKAMRRVFTERRKAGRPEKAVTAMIDLGDRYPDSFPKLIRVVRAEDGTLLQIVMEKMEGMNLADFWAENIEEDVDEDEGGDGEELRVGISVQLDIAVKIAIALHRLHMSGRVHRDLKPSNVFVCEDGTVKILDLMHIMCRKQDGFTPKFFAGTPAYASPEACINVTDVDYRSDMYAFGIILYELFSRERMHDHKLRPHEIMARVMNTYNLLPSTLPCDLPPELNELVKSLLYRAPVQRPRDMLEVGRTLTQILIQREPYLRMQEPYYSILGKVTDL